MPNNATKKGSKSEMHIKKDPPTHNIMHGGVSFILELLA
jgi:hypothetical protein